MRYNFISPIHGLQIEKTLEPISLMGFNIDSGNKTLDTHFSLPGFQEFTGRIFIDQLQKHVYGFSLINNDEPLVEKTDQFNRHVTASIDCLWFVKDNSVSSASCAGLNMINPDCEFRTNSTMISNSSARFVVTPFSVAELKSAEKIYNKLLSLHSPVDDDYKKRADPSGTVSVLSITPYNSQNRIIRANIILQVARSNSLLPMKIAFYIAVLECLFTTNNLDITNTVSRRAASYLSTNDIMFEDIKRKVKLAYDVRSKFVHGDEMKTKFNTREKLTVISKNIDEIVRQALVKVIMTDSTTFIKPKKELQLYFEGTFPNELKWFSRQKKRLSLLMSKLNTKMIFSIVLSLY